MKSQMLASQPAVSTDSLPSNGHKKSISRQELWRAPYAHPGQCQELLWLRHQIESPKHHPKKSAQRRLPQSDLPQ
jgi:hypothetical protein